VGGAGGCYSGQNRAFAHIRTSLPVKISDAPF
jgi:hypothetical protein